MMVLLQYNGLQISTWQAISKCDTFRAHISFCFLIMPRTVLDVGEVSCIGVRCVANTDITLSRDTCGVRVLHRWQQTNEHMQIQCSCVAGTLGYPGIQGVHFILQASAYLLHRPNKYIALLPPKLRETCTYHQHTNNHPKNTQTPTPKGKRKPRKKNWLNQNLQPEEEKKNENSKDPTF